MRCIALWVSLLVWLPSAWAVEIEGVHIPDQVVVEGSALQLNGAGVRTKFFFDIYVGALYLPQARHQAAVILAKPYPAHVSMDILYGKVDKEKLAKGWNAGFEKNLSKPSYKVLQARLSYFNKMFPDVRKGDHLAFDFLSDGTTVVRLQGRELGRVSGEDFQKALLQVWLGDKPADRDLKKAMLQGVK